MHTYDFTLLTFSELEQRDHNDLCFWRRLCWFGYCSIDANEQWKE